jgi:DNA-binding LytR/AlgR family response regulator
MPPLKIIIFEDEFLLANDLKRQIQQFDYEVIAIFRKAEDGLKFLEGIHQPAALPDIVLMDISLAGKMSGIEAARIMVAKYDFALVFLTGMSQMDVFEEAFKTKPHAFLIKPFDVQQAIINIRLAVYQKTLENRLLKYQDELEEKIIERTGELKLSKDQAEEEIKRKCTLLDNLGILIRDPMLEILHSTSKLNKHLPDSPNVQHLIKKIDDQTRQVFLILDEIEGLKSRK